MSYRTDEKTPPPFFMCAYFERSCNPFDPAIIAESLGGKKVKEKPETGWMSIDWGENAIGFTHDSTFFDCDKPDFTIEKGYFADGRMFAYQKNKYLAELKERHKKEIEKMSTNEYLIDASTRHQIMLQRLSGGHYKYEAWKAGKISGADFVDGKGAEIDLSYLKSLDSITL